MKPNTKTSETSSEIADDLLTEIFRSLPTKSLVRFQSVSKHWQYLITNPQFHNLRNSNLNPPSVGLIFPIPNMARGISRTYAYVVPFDKSSTPFRKLHFNHTSASPWEIKIMSSCNGFLVCAVKEFHYSVWDYYVCNPTINRYSKLPKVDEKSNWMSTTQYWMHLAFDPSRSPHYQVVCVRELRGQYEFAVYLSEKGFWEKRGEPLSTNVNFEKGVYCNGAIHWIGCTKKSIYFNPDDDQMPRVMPTPPINAWTRYYFGETCGHLQYCDHLQYIDAYCIKIYVYEMRHDYSEWFVKFKVDLPWDVMGLFTICNVVRGSNDEDSFLLLNIWGRIVRYNLVYGTFEILHEFKVTDIGGYNLVHACSRRIEAFTPGLNPPDVVIPLQYIVSLCSV